MAIFVCMNINIASRLTHPAEFVKGGGGYV